MPPSTRSRRAVAHNTPLLGESSDVDAACLKDVTGSYTKTLTFTLLSTTTP